MQNYMQLKLLTPLTFCNILMCLLNTQILLVSICSHQTFQILNISSEVYVDANNLIVCICNVNINTMDNTSVCVRVCVCGWVCGGVCVCICLPLCNTPTPPPTPTPPTIGHGWTTMYQMVSGYLIVANTKNCFHFDYI